jgi:ribosomal protein L32
MSRHGTALGLSAIFRHLSKADEGLTTNISNSLEASRLTAIIIKATATTTSVCPDSGRRSLLHRLSYRMGDEYLIPMRQVTGELRRWHGTGGASQDCLVVNQSIELGKRLTLEFQVLGDTLLHQKPRVCSLLQIHVNKKSNRTPSFNTSQQRKS